LIPFIGKIIEMFRSVKLLSASTDTCERHHYDAAPAPQYLQLALCVRIMQEFFNPAYFM
jgi:hypothetical protein